MATKAERNEMRQPDEFQVQAARAMDWIIARKNALIGAAVVIVALVVGVWAVSEYQGSQDDKAGAELSAALALVARPVMGEAAASQPGIETFPSEDVKTKALTDAFEKVRTDHPGAGDGRAMGRVPGRPPRRRGPAGHRRRRHLRPVRRLRGGGRRDRPAGAAHRRRPGRAECALPAGDAVAAWGPAAR